MGVRYVKRGGGWWILSFSFCYTDTSAVPSAGRRDVMEKQGPCRRAARTHSQHAVCGPRRSGEGAGRRWHACCIVGQRRHCKGTFSAPSIAMRTARPLTPSRQRKAIKRGQQIRELSGPHRPHNAEEAVILPLLTLFLQSYCCKAMENFHVHLCEGCISTMCFMTVEM